MKNTLSLIMLISFFVAGSARAELACDTQAHITFDDDGIYTGATFERCEITIMVPTVKVIEGFSVDANGDVITLSWVPVETDLDGDSFTLEKYVVSIDGQLFDVEPDRVNWTSGQLSSGNHLVKMEAVKVNGNRSGFTPGVAVSI